MVILTEVVLLVGTLVRGTRLGSEFLPELDEGSIWLTATLDPSASLGEAQLQSRRIRDLVTSFPEVSTVVAKLGRPEDGSDAKGANQIQALMALKPESAWERKMDNKELVAQMPRLLEERIPGPELSISQPLRDSILESTGQGAGRHQGQR